MSFQQDSARSHGRGDQAGMGPSSAYPQSTPPQFPPSNFQYPSSDYPSLDTDLDMAGPFPHSIGSQLQEAAAAGAPPRNGDINAISVNTNGSVAAGMGPPQTPQQSSFSPTGPRASVDETPDSATPVEDSNKRRRSKVSRACDECRRKKIKCDSADTPDGSIKTCTNCAKASMDCQFSRVPMKRGPSKGYIKELSERVEKMESRQAAMGQPGYRQSLDGASMTDAMYSPEDGMSAKRQFSFSSDAPNPFAPTDYQRDRMPSADGTWSSDLPAQFGSRDRGSLALAPDQHLPGTVAANSWDDAEDLKPPPPKRQKLGPDSPAVKMDSAHLTNYEEAIHPEFPFLPDRATTSNNILALAQNTESVRVFATVLDLFPSSRTTQQNGNTPDVFADSGLFSTSDDLFTSVAQLISQDPTRRTNIENLILMWSCVLLAVQREFDIRTNRTDPSYARRSTLLQNGLDLSTYLLNTASSSSEEDTTIRDAVKQAKILTHVMIRFDWFSSGVKSNWSRLPFLERPRPTPAFSREDYDAFQDYPNANFLTRAAYSLKTVHNLLPLPGDDRFAMLQKEDEFEKAMYDCVDASGGPKGFTDQTLIVRQVFEYMKLILSPFHERLMPPMVIMSRVFRMAEYLSEAPVAAESLFRYSMIDYHFFTITIISLLAFLDKVPDPKGCRYAEEALDKLKPLVEQKLAIYDDAIKTREKESRQYPGFYGKDRDGKDAHSRTWMGALLKMISDRPKEKWAISREPAQFQGGQAGQEFIEDFHVLMQTGYGRVLAGYAGREA